MTAAGTRGSLGLYMSVSALRYFAPWIIAVVALCAAIPAVAAAFVDVEFSAWNIGTHTGKIFAAIVVGSWLYATVPTAIANGVTRRRFTGAIAVLTLVWSLFMGAVAVLGYLAEHGYYAMFGWEQTISTNNGGRTLESWGETAAHAAGYPPIFVLYAVAGAVIGAACYRWEGTGWISAIPAGLLVLVCDAAVLSIDQFGPGWLHRITGIAEEWRLSAALALTAVAIAAGVLCARRLLSDIPIRSRST